MLILLGQRMNFETISHRVGREHVEEVTTHMGPQDTQYIQLNSAIDATYTQVSKL